MKTGDRETIDKSSASHKGYIESFQGLRGYAILLIFVSHCNFIQNRFGYNYFAWLGAFGVSIFIMMSGYLLMKRYPNTKLITKKDFLIKKLKKFYPLHLLTLFLSLPLCYKSLIGAGSWKQWGILASNVLLLQAWVPRNYVYFSFNAVSWYLSITVFFALVSPYIVKLVQTLQKRIVFAVVLTVILEFIWCTLTCGMTYAHWLIYVFPIARCLDFFIGAACVLIQEKSSCQNDMKKCTVFFLSSVFILCILSVISIDTQSEYFSVCFWTVPVILLLLSVAMGDKQSRLIIGVFQNKAAMFMGEISFEFFLIHQLVIRYVEKICTKLVLDRNLWQYFIAFVISVLLSVGYRYVVKMMKNRNQLSIVRPN